MGSAKFTRREILSLGVTAAEAALTAAIPLAPLPVLAQAEESQSNAKHYLYEASGEFYNILFRLNAHFTESVDTNANIYKVDIEGKKGILVGFSIYSHGFIDQGRFKPLKSLIHLSGMLPAILLQRDTEITYHYKPLKPYALFNQGGKIWNIPLNQNLQLDDIGSAYLNYKYGNYQKTKFGIWLLSGVRKPPTYNLITVIEDTSREGYFLTTIDLSKFLKGIDKNSKSTARLSLEQRIVEEAKMRVRSRDISIRRIA